MKPETAFNRRQLKRSDRSVRGKLRFDGDADVDLADFLVFQGCFNGANRSYHDSPSCRAADFDGDFDVDLADFLAFPGCFNGPNRPPAAGCLAP
jgi:hypothetical protein